MIAIRGRKYRLLRAVTHEGQVLGLQIQRANARGRSNPFAAETQDDPAPIDWHPNAMEIYKRSICDLSATLNADDASRDLAVATIRTLVDRIVAYPGERRGQFDPELHG